MRLYKNQLIAKEGILTYTEHGRVLKQWENLKESIGKKVEILDYTHPSKENPTRNVIGYGIIKKCPIGQNLLCGDLTFFNSDVKRKGYSIGTISDLINKPGKFGNEEYDKIQVIKDIDHLAYVDNPRDQNALMGDATNGNISGADPVFIKERNNINNNSYILISDTYEITGEGLEETSEEVDDMKENETEQTKKETVISDAIQKQLDRLIAENKKLNDRLDQNDKKERKRLVDQIQAKVPKMVIDDTIDNDKLEFAITLLSHIEDSFPEEHEVRVGKVSKSGKKPEQIEDELIPTEIQMSTVNDTELDMMCSRFTAEKGGLTNGE
jgi:hypothetical protein